MVEGSGAGEDSVRKVQLYVFMLSKILLVMPVTYTCECESECT